MTGTTVVPVTRAELNTSCLSLKCSYKVHLCLVSTGVFFASYTVFLFVYSTQGKTYLLKDKQRIVDYYKKQREIQHRHYHAMLKMSHGMMTRIKQVKAMCQKAGRGEKLSAREMQELGGMAPAGM